MFCLKKHENSQSGAWRCHHLPILFAVTGDQVGNATAYQQQTPLPASRTHATARATATTIVPMAIVRRLVSDRPPYRAARKSPTATARANPPPATLTTEKISFIAR